MPSTATLTAGVPVVLSTDTAGPAERMSVWRQALSTAYVRLEPVVRTDPECWRGSLSVDRLGSLQVATEESDPVKVLRTPQGAAADGLAYVFARIQLEGSALLFQDGRSARLDPGDLAFYDASRPFSLVLPEHHRARVLMVPRPMVRMGDTEVRRITATAVGDSPDGPSALLLPLLSGLTREIGSASPHVREKLARTVADLLSTLAEDLLNREGRRPAGTGPATLLDRIKAFIESRLGEPELAPRMIAGEHHISLRYLHKLFQTQGTTVSGWIRRRRLDACRAELARPAAADLAIAAVAARWGFTSPAHFSHAFRRAYGVSPSQWRTSCLRMGPAAGRLVAGAR
ncbi:helix-turn-helix domain-containing protein [Streptomyces sp. ISL-36]|uniref:helix-turn-helix domain-containing protein n=1 Tax=Streptomyces sp. ISL-36 TaxID=2819182 RepID=UPI001BEA7121|nr:helix-turn-helix domain-containing protein [Streptomyces sp. ISL-36]MBT2445461.1 helix-turn-helix domain-containing protein [Streptomyces sp. ISL-36]